MFNWLKKEKIDKHKELWKLQYRHYNPIVDVFIFDGENTPSTKAQRRIEKITKQTYNYSIVNIGNRHNILVVTLASNPNQFWLVKSKEGLECTIGGLNVISYLDQYDTII